MSSNLRDPRGARPEDQEASGLAPDELRAEQADELPERDAMSIIGVGALEGGLPPAGLLDGVLDADAPAGKLPVDGLPVEQYPVEPLPVERLPIDPLPPVVTLPVEPPVVVLPTEPPGDTLPVEPPVDGDPIGIPELPATSADASVEA